MQAHTHEPTALDLLRYAREAVPWLAQQAGDIDARRSVPDTVAERLAAAGLHRMLTPQAYGGLELEVAPYLQIIETLAQGSASVAWCTFISCTAAVVGAYLPPDQARPLFSDPLVRWAGVFAPRGTAVPEILDGVSGYRVSGRWPWGSGSLNAHWLSGGCLILEAGGRPRALPDGTPVVQSVVFARPEVTIHDTWHVMGLRGTGSHEFEVHDLFVPAARTASLMNDMPLPRPLYKFPVFGLLALSIAAVALGVSRLAIDTLTALAGGKTPQGSSKPLALRAATQEQVALAEARLRSARAWLFDAVQAAHDAAHGPGAIDTALRRDLRLAATHTVREAADIVTAMHRLAGGTSVFEASPLERCVRDVNVMTQHMMVGDSTLELAGRLFLGLPTQTSML